MAAADWTAGYVADVGYIFGYYPELSPYRARWPLLNAGFVCPEFRTACELGFGQGISVNIHAGASEATWFGTDFNPSQAAFARDLAASSGSSAQLDDEAFADFCGRDELPQFDFIGLHGIWSWISDANREVLVDFVRRKLSVGGVLYISYNTQPGWASFAPMRHLLTQHADVIGAPGTGTVSRIEAALDFADRLIATEPRYGMNTPQVGERLALMRGQPRSYLAHEYFNRDWHPTQFSTVADWLAPAKVSFACSANLLDHIEAINLTADQQRLLAEIPDLAFRQDVRDFIVNQQFRKDYWIKGPRRLSSFDQNDALRKERVVLAVPGESVSLKVVGGLGEAGLNAEVYQPILAALSDHKVRSIAELETAVSGAGIALPLVLEAVSILKSQGSLMPVQPQKTAQAVKPKTDALNLRLMAMARSSGENDFLASPVSGGGIQVSRFAQIFLAARAAGRKKPGDWADYAWDILVQQGQRIVKDGKTLETEAENRAELLIEAETLEVRLPALMSLGIA